MKRFNYIKKIKTMKYTKLVLGIIIGVLISGYPIYYASTILYAANEVGYNHDDSGLASSTVQDAIDELDGDLTTAITTGCPANAICIYKKNWSEVAVGDYVQMTPNPGTLDASDRYATDTTKTGYSSVQYIYPKELKLWKVIKVNNNGTVEMVSEYVSSTGVYFKGAIGYANGVGYLNTLANQYQNPAYTISARIIGYNGSTEYISNTSAFDGTNNAAPWDSSTTTAANQLSENESLGQGDTMYLYDTALDTGLVQIAYGNLGSESLITKKCNDTNCSNPTAIGLYWLGSRQYTKNSSYAYFQLRRITNAGTADNMVMRNFNISSSVWNDVGTSNAAIRPIVTLKAGISPASAVGTKEYPFILN